MLLATCRNSTQACAGVIPPPAQCLTQSTACGWSAPSYQRLAGLKVAGGA